MKQIIVLFLFFQFFAASAVAQQYKYHIVQRGETTAEIARQYNISEETLFKYNPDARNGISVDSKLVVPLEAQTEVSENVKFETHRVKRKETLFSLSQQYNVSIENIKKYNKHLYSEELRRGEKIRIPVNLPKKVEQKEEVAPPSPSNLFDLSIKEHVVLPKETLYGISRKYNITIADLQRLNPRLETLKPGMVLKVKNGNTEKVVDVAGSLFKYYQVKPQETLFSLTRRFGISKDSLLTLNPALADGLKSGMVLKIPNIEIYEPGEYTESKIVNLERELNNFSTKNIVVMLPFNLDKIVATDTSDNAIERLKKDRVMQISLDFYSGVLMAVDSAKAMGISTNLRFYDTQQNPGKVYSIISSNNFTGVDAVIGPLLQSTVEAAASGLEKQNVPVISPLTKKRAGSMQNFLQARPTDEMLAEAMISYITDHANGKNIVIISDADNYARKNRLLQAFPNARVVNPRQGGYIDQQQLKTALMPERPNYVILEASKIGVLSSATSYLNSMAEDYEVTLFTTDRNNSYESDNVSNRHLTNLNFHYPSISKVYSLDTNRSFIKKYQASYGVVPNTYAVRGFDVTYDVLLRLASSNDIYTSVAREGATQYIENKFEYERRAMGGFQNKAVYIVAYGKDLTLEVVQQ
ncbi:MAG: LysM peptidoglycan-binding domain-containing protein [Salinimicrobium sp.]